MILHDVFYAPYVRQNLFSVLAVSLGYSIRFENNGVTISHGTRTNVFGYGFIMNGFMVLDTIDSSINSNDSYSLLKMMFNSMVC